MRLLNLCWHLLVIFALSVAEEVCRTSLPLGMITGEIANWQVTASSVYPKEWEKGCQTENARIFEKSGRAWCPLDKSPAEWLQLDLGVPAVVTGFLTQGRADGKEWVTKYRVSCSENGFNWTYIKNRSGNERVFPGNGDSFSVKHVYLDEPRRARYLKFHPQAWIGHPSMRVEAFGCQKCKQLLGVPPYASVRASSIGVGKKKLAAPACKAEDGFIQSPTGWCARKKDKQPWLQFDLGPPTLITGVVTKGRGESTRRPQWVSNYKLAYSNNSRTWTWYNDTSAEGVKIAKEFDGNSDADSAQYHYLERPVVARFLRFYPIRWRSRCSMRASVIGCRFEGECPPEFMRVNEGTPCMENMAYKKKAWSYTKRNLKRYLPTAMNDPDAERATDGRFNTTLHACSPLNNIQVQDPTWLVDIGKQRAVSGIVIYLWRPDSPGVRESYEHSMTGLNKISAYVYSRPVYRVSYLGDKDAAFCDSILNLNNALISNPRLHLTCEKPLRGKYVYISATGGNKLTENFSTYLCEVMVYE